MTHSRSLSLLCLLAFIISWTTGLHGQDPAKKSPEAVPVKPVEVAPEAAPESKSPVAKYITVTSPVNETLFNRIRNALVVLQQQATQEKRQAVLVLELERGKSSFGQVRDVAKELTSAKYSNVKTVAWIPSHPEGRRLDGYVGILALACQDIVMHPDAEFGDVGRGSALDADEQQFVLNMIEKRYNAKLNSAIVGALIAPNLSLHKVRVSAKNAGGQDVPETRYVGADELKRLQDSNVPILSVDTIKEPREVAVFTGARAKSLEILVSHAIQDRPELVDLYGFDRQYLREDIGTGGAPNAKIIKLTGVITSGLREFIERELAEAENERANLIILEIDSPGGELEASLKLADRLRSFDPKRMRIVAYIPDRALSGAAIVALGCDDIIMHPEAQIGDAGPIQMRRGGQFERAPEKILSSLRQNLKVLADAKNRPSALCEAMSAKDLEVFKVTHRDTGRVWYMTDAEIQNSENAWIKGPRVPESGGENLLTVIGKRAFELKIASEPVQDFSELKQRLGIPKEKVVPAAQATWVDDLVEFLRSPGVTFLLFVVGLLCVYMEAQTSTGFFLVGAIFSFGLFFWSHYMGGTAGWLELILFLIGVGLIAVEFFFIPGFGIFGIAGGFSVIVSIILASQTFVVPSTGEEFRELALSMGQLSGAILVVGVLGVVLSLYMHRLPGIRNLILAPPGADEPLLDPRVVGGPIPSTSLGVSADMVGQSGVAYTSLRPAGKAQLGGRLIDVVSSGEYIEPGTAIQVVEITGNKIVVASSANV